MAGKVGQTMSMHTDELSDSQPGCGFIIADDRGKSCIAIATSPRPKRTRQRRRSGRAVKMTSENRHIAVMCGRAVSVGRNRTRQSVL